MNQQLLDLFASLAAPFEPEEVRTRPQGNRLVNYVTARTVMNRLDDVLGPSNWWDDYNPQQNSVICRLTIRLPDGTTLTKADAGGYAGMPDSGDDDKSGFSDAFKRAAVKFGIGRYLYRDGTPKFVQKHLRAAAASGHATAQPAPAEKSAPAEKTAQETGSAPANGVRPASDGHATPKTGKALFAWIKHQDERHGTDLLKLISDWGKAQDFPERMIHWNSDQVEQAMIEAQAALDEPEADPAPSPAKAAPPEPAKGSRRSRTEAQPAMQRAGSNGAKPRNG